MKCPFDDETTLADIVDKSSTTEISAKIKVFKTTLTRQQWDSFNEIDDMMTGLVTRTQHNTLKQLYCPRCKQINRNCT